MFTGIVEDVAQVVDLRHVGDVVCLEVTTQLDLGDTKLGDSIAVNGVCLTVTALVHAVGAGATRVRFDMGPETLRVTALAALTRGGGVHLERALRLSDRLGGHLVQGHVDGVGTLVERRTHHETLELRFEAPAAVLALCIPKGSIAIDGVSLTLNQVDERAFEVWLIPHTLERTRLSEVRVGDRVNVENDLIGKYVRQLLGGHAPGTRAGVSWELLERAGFLGSS